MARMEFDGVDDVLNDLKRMGNEIDDFECPECGEPFTLDLGAKTVTCPHCSAEIQISH